MLKAELNKSEKLLHLINKEDIVHTEIVDKKDIWFSATVDKKSYNFNFTGNELGMFENVKVAKNTYETGDFINAIDIIVT